MFKSSSLLIYYIKKMFDREFIINYDFNDEIFYKITPLIFTLTHIRNSTVQINVGEMN